MMLAEDLRLLGQRSYDCGVANSQVGIDSPGIPSPTGQHRETVEFYTFSGFVS